MLSKLIFCFLSAVTICLAPCSAKVVQAWISPTEQTVSHYDEENEQLRQIETYHISANGKKIICLETFEWHPLFPHLPIKRSLIDEHGNPLLNMHSSYNELGQLTEEIVKRSLDAPYYIRHTFDYSLDGKCLHSTFLEMEASPLANMTLQANIFQDLAESFDNNIGRYIYEELELLVRMSGHYEEPLEASVFPGTVKYPNIRITFINGILNAKNDLLTSVKRICEAHGGAYIHYVFRPTQGWAWDLLKSTLVKMGIASPEAHALAQLWKQLIAEMGGTEGGGTIIHYAHSIGGANTYVAKFLLTPEEQKMIQVVAIGSPTIIPQGGFQSVINYISVRDGVGLYLGPIGRLSALFEDNSHIAYVGSYYGIPIIDHLLEMDTYREIIEYHGVKFLERYSGMID